MKINIIQKIIGQVEDIAVKLGLSKESLSISDIDRQMHGGPPIIVRIFSYDVNESSDIKEYILYFDEQGDLKQVEFDFNIRADGGMNESSPFILIDKNGKWWILDQYSDPMLKEFEN